MKKLQRIRLICWHRFINETIELADSVLLSGENGAGKSTLLDAIQFAVTCSKAHFNKAAHEKGKRNLNGYMRCKTGREDRPYERTGEISSHIALEFYDEARKQPFLIGVVMDSASEEREPNAAWYLMEKQQLEDDLFLRGEQVKSISVFRSTNSQIRTFATTQAEARRMILARFGRLEETFFSLIPKALAFKPIHDIKDFVYSYVLDEKEVNIDSLKENVRSYQDLERMLQDVKARIEELEQINKVEEEVERCLRIDRNHEYYLARAEVDLTKEAQRQEEQERRKRELAEEEEKRRRESLSDRLQDKQNARISLEAELKGDADYQAFDELKRQEKELERELVKDEKGLRCLRDSAKEAKQQGKRILQSLDDASNGALGGLLEKTTGEASLEKACIREYVSLLDRLEELDGITEISLCLEQAIGFKKELCEKNQKAAGIREREKKDRDDRLKQLRDKIGKLEKKQLTYSAEVTVLAAAIREQLHQTGRSGEVRVLCELLEITNPAWQNAVEGYLNNQRFYLLVEPEDFDLAVSVYDRMRENKKVYGAGLIYAARLEEYDEAPEGSLAEVVTSKSLWARRYINMILGRVKRCQRYQDLKQHSIAITRQCMRYQNHVVSAIRPEIYQTPYIGHEAYRHQLEQCQAQEGQLMQEQKQLEGELAKLEAVRDALDTRSDVDLKHYLHVLGEWREHQLQKKRCRESIEKLEKNTTLIEKQIYLQKLREEEKDIQQQISDGDKRIGELQAEKRQLTLQLEKHKSRLAVQEEELNRLVEKLGQDALLCEREYERQRRGRTPGEFKDSFQQARKGNWTKKERAEGELIQRMRDYKIAHDFGAAESLEGYGEFLAEYNKLKNSQILVYEEKVQKARQAAEEEFREQFLSKLQENIRQAQGEFRELNRSLQDIHFSRERYEFRYEPNRRLKRYYDMIMDDFNILQGESIFSGIFQENHREVIEELFEKLTLDDADSAKVLEEYTDYRTYMDYDIKIQSEDGSYMLYSKVSQEKSGGETQTPFYITVAASFMQLYRNSIGGDSVGLVMLDEAFNNMDDERIAGVLEFMTHTNLQVIIAAPPDKIQYIGPAVKKILLVLQDDRFSYVEDFTKG